MIRTTRNPILGSASFWTQDLSIIGFKTKTLSELVSDMFKNGEQGFFYDPNSLTDGTYGVDQTGIGQPVTVGVADAAEYDIVLHTGMVYRADQYNQSIVNFDVDNTKSHELVIENNGSTTIAVNADLAMGAVLFTVAAGQKVTRIIDPIQVIVITSANDVSTAYFKIHSLKEFSGQYTMYQDDTGNVSVTCAGQSIGLMLDKSGINNHARQTTSSMRPLLAASPQRLDFTTVDSKLITTLPVQLTDCTVIRSVPNVGTQILTGQTIPTTYEDDKDHCGLIVINRALTPNETSVITAEFNKMAGV